MGSVLHSLGIDGTFFVEIVNFILLLLLLSWRAFPATKRTIENRRSKIEADLGAAEEQRQEAVRLKEQHLAELQNARAEAQAIIDRAQRIGADQSRALLDEARALAERQRRSASEDITRERDAALAVLRSEVAGLVLAATDKLVRARVDRNAEADRELVEEFIGDVGRQP